jgi:hypothetical protein
MREVGGTSPVIRSPIEPSSRATPENLDEVRWPAHLMGIELVWHRLNREHDLRRFFRSAVHWAECDARMEPSGEIVLSHTPGMRGDRPFADWIADVASAGRGAKIDLKEGGPVLEAVLGIVGSASIHDEDLWFNCAAEIIGGRPGFEAISTAHPLARISVPVDTLASWLLVCPDRGLDLLAELRIWGVDRLSVSVQTPAFQEVVQLLKHAGWATNVWDVSRMAQLADAIGARPRSITADLGILRWPDEF